METRIQVVFVRPIESNGWKLIGFDTLSGTISDYGENGLARSETTEALWRTIMVIFGKRIRPEQCVSTIPICFLEAICHQETISEGEILKIIPDTGHLW